MNIYVTTDTHFCHEKIKTMGQGRPDDYEERILKALRKIPKDSIFIHLGDVSMGFELESHKDILEATKQCKKRILVRGNHDNKSYNWYYNVGWDFVCETFRMRYLGKELLFSHYPVLKVDSKYTIHLDVDKNIHGHLHGRGNDSHRAVGGYDKNFNYDAAVDTHDYKPIALKQII